jgi:hypothetical protein
MYLEGVSRNVHRPASIPSFATLHASPTEVLLLYPPNRALSPRGRLNRTSHQRQRRRRNLSPRHRRTARYPQSAWLRREFETLTGEMVASAQAESGVLAYRRFISEDRQTVYVHERYENSAAAVAHLVKFVCASRPAGCRSLPLLPLRCAQYGRVPLSASVVRSRAMVTHAIDRHRWNEITDGAVLLAAEFLVSADLDNSAIFLHRTSRLSAAARR